MNQAVIVILCSLFGMNMGRRLITDYCLRTKQRMHDESFSPRVFLYLPAVLAVQVAMTCPVPEGRDAQFMSYCHIELFLGLSQALKELRADRNMSLQSHKCLQPVFVKLMPFRIGRTSCEVVGFFLSVVPVVASDRHIDPNDKEHWKKYANLMRIWAVMCY